MCLFIMVVVVVVVVVVIIVVCHVSFRVLFIYYMCVVLLNVMVFII